MFKYIKENLLSYYLKQKIRKLPALKHSNNNEAEKFWIDIRNNIRYNIMNNRVKTFYDWSVLKNYFIAGDNDYIKVEVELIKQSPNFLKYESAIKDTSYIKLHNSKYFVGSNPTRIHHAYHIQQFEDSTLSKINDFDFILEFGGGYGNLSHYIRKMGYKGKYVIFDCPELIYLQEYYIGNSNLSFKVLDNSNREIDNSSIFGVYDQKILNNLTSKFEKGLFIGTWSISETALSFREEFSNNNFIKKFNNYLFAFQEKFYDTDNVKYFNKWLTKNNFKDYVYRDIYHIPDSNNKYLFALKNSINKQILNSNAYK